MDNNLKVEKSLIEKMKKLILFLVLGTLIGATALPLITIAQTPPSPTGGISSCTLRHDITIAGETKNKGDSASYETDGVFCIMDAIYTATDWVFAITLAIAILFVIWGGFLIITGGGSLERVTKGRNYIIYAVVGFIIAMLSKAIPYIAKWFLTG